MQQCQVSDSNTSNEITDKRYKEIEGWSVNEAALLHAYGIATQLQTIGINDYSTTMNLKAKTFFKAYQRPTIDYSLLCEDNGQTRKDAYDVFMSQQSHDLTFDDL